jgi:hypothetical protein
MEPIIISALIAAMSGIAAALIAAHWQMKTKTKELDLKEQEIKRTLDLKSQEMETSLDLKRQEIERTSAKMNADAEALRQTLMRDVLLKRMQAYAALWRVFITYERNWLYEGKPFDLDWAVTFLAEINSCNAEHGVFFSERVYHSFFRYRERLLDIVSEAKRGIQIQNRHIEKLVEISTKGTIIDGEKVFALGAVLKDDLGSYIPVAIQAA